MMYVTNGKVQDLPEGTQFDYWTVVDVAYAHSIASLHLAQWFASWEGKISIEDAKLFGLNSSTGAKMVNHSESLQHEYILADLMDTVVQDPYRVFTSRPKGQKIDWAMWANFCTWFIDMAYRSMFRVPRNSTHDATIVYKQNLSNIRSWIRSGRVDAWYPQFMYAISDGSGRSMWQYCFDGRLQDKYSFYKFSFFPSLPFLVAEGRTDTTPPVVPTTAWQDFTAWLKGDAGKKQQFASMAASIPLQSPSPVSDEIAVEITEPARPESSGTSWGPIIFAGGSALFLAYLLTRK